MLQYLWDGFDDSWARATRDRSPPHVAISKWDIISEWNGSSTMIPTQTTQWTTFAKEFEFAFTFEFELLSHVGSLVSPCAHKHVSTRIRINIFACFRKGDVIGFGALIAYIYTPRRILLWSSRCRLHKLKKDYDQIIAYYARRIFTYVIGKYDAIRRFGIGEECSALVRTITKCIAGQWLWSRLCIQDREILG
jgi:hypothetical protein